MDKFCLHIADCFICFKRGNDCLEFAPAQGLNEFLTDQHENNITITVYNSKFPKPISETELFSAPFMLEENEGLFVKKSDSFWAVFLADGKKVIRVYDPATGITECDLLPDSDPERWELYSNKESVCADPFSYPLDGLILYYALQQSKNNILIHASAVDHEGRGFLFTGVSGKGKTTISQLWEEAGATVIHDDLVVISKGKNGSVLASSTPLNGNPYSRQTELDTIFLIEHSPENIITPLKGAEALSYVLSNTIQHNYDRQIICDHLEVINGILDTVPVYKIGFIPDTRIVDSIKDLIIKSQDKIINEIDSEFTAIEAVLAVLESGKQVELNAAGLSMFPTIRPGDRILVKPISKDELPSTGNVVICVEKGIMSQVHEKGVMAQRHKGKKAEIIEPVLVMHRLVEIRNVGNCIAFITRGDSMDRNDKPWSRDQLLGVALKYKRNGKVYPVKTFLPGRISYKFNKLLVWLNGSEV